MALPPKERRTFSLVKIAPFVVGLLLAITILPIVGTGYWAARENTGRLLRSQQDAVLDGLELQLRGALDGIATQMSLVGRLISAGVVDPSDRRPFSRFMIGVVTGQSSAMGVGFLEASGPFRIWSRDTSQETATERDQVVDLDVIWNRAKETQYGFWNRPFYNKRLGRGIIPHIQPVYRNGQFLGILVTAVTWEAVSEYINTLQKDIVPFVLVGRDRVIVHPNIGAAMLNTGDLPMLGDVQDQALAEMWRDPRSSTLPGQEQARSTTHWSFVGGTSLSHQYHYRTISAYGPLPWTIGFHQNTSNTLRERSILEGLFYLSIFLLLLASGLAYLFIRRAVGPAQSVAESARALERLDFANVPRTDLDNSRFREVRDTSHALERAAGALARFQTYVPRALVSQLMAMGASQSTASDREVSILFMDLSGYTAFSEGRSAVEVAHYLNGIFARIGPIIETHGGTIDKYTGDGLLAVWGAPVAEPEHARRAWEAACDIVHAMTPFMAADLAADPRRCRMRLGLHSGRVLAGDIGFPGRTDYTVVGRTVNIAQRTQAALKGHMRHDVVALAISQSALDAIGDISPSLERLANGPGEETLYRINLDLTIEHGAHLQPAAEAGP
jgi:adenylate cyclase